MLLILWTGLATGLFAAALWALFAWLLRRWTNRRNFGPLQGTYRSARSSPTSAIAASATPPR